MFDTFIITRFISRLEKVSCQIIFVGYIAYTYVSIPPIILNTESCKLAPGKQASWRKGVAATPYITLKGIDNTHVFPSKTILFPGIISEVQTSTSQNPRSLFTVLTH